MTRLPNEPIAAVRAARVYIHRDGEASALADLEDLCGAEQVAQWRAQFKWDERLSAFRQSLLDLEADASKPRGPLDRQPGERPDELQAFLRWVLRRDSLNTHGCGLPDARLKHAMQAHRWDERKAEFMASLERVGVETFARAYAEQSARMGDLFRTARDLIHERAAGAPTVSASQFLDLLLMSEGTGR